MARFNKMQVMSAIQATGMVPVFYHADAEIAKQVVKACYEGGVRAFEFTNRGDFASEVFIEVIKIGLAQELGCDLTKVFPAGNVGGPSFVKNVKAPLPWSNIMATGAVEPTEENLTAWFKAGVFCVGMGSQLFPKEVIAAKDWKAVSEKCRFALDVIAKVR